MNDLDDPVGGEDDEETDEGAGNGFFTIVHLVAVASIGDHGKAAKDDHEKDDDAGGDVDIREDIVDQGARVFVLSRGGRALEKEFGAEIEAVCHIGEL